MIGIMEIISENYKIDDKDFKRLKNESKKIKESIAYLKGEISHYFKYVYLDLYYFNDDIQIEIFLPQKPDLAEERILKYIVNTHERVFLSLNWI